MDYHVSMNCAHCGAEFTPKPWPSTRTKYCQILCGKRAYTARNFPALREKWQKYQRDFRDRRLKSQRLYNNSEKGRAVKAKYQEKHPERSARYLASYHADPSIRGIQLSRERARKTLKRSGVEYRCELCVSVTSLLHCHHVDENSFNNALINLSWLCRNCHATVHSDPVGLDDQTIRSILEFQHRHRISA